MTEAEVTYTYYTESYGGGLAEAAFVSVIGAALRHVRWVVNGRQPITPLERRAYKRAVCACVDVFAEFGEGQVGGFAIGDFKVTHYEDQGTTGTDQATQVAVKELCGTSLLFAGAR